MREQKLTWFLFGAETEEKGAAGIKGVRRTRRFSPPHFLEMHGRMEKKELK